MRLIHTRNLTFEEFIGDNIPPYAIVSHRWGADEVSYQDLLEGRHRHTYGWTKIVKGCELALERRYQWLWIDTCCLDKKSSAELSEGINSMFQWYRNSQECFVFLHDVPEVRGDHSARKSVHNSRSAWNASYYLEDFQNSSWFTRGWTLQELLAPRLVQFYNASFQPIQHLHSCTQEISRITGIHARYFDTATSALNLEGISVAERMSWVARRHTTRPEDMAYSLLGIFDVNMPLLYGEGKKAFMRLQLEIIRKSEDESIFAWFTDDTSWRGLLAPTPQAFAATSTINYIPGQPTAPFTMTNKGLELRLDVPASLTLPDYRQGSVTMLMPLNCEETNTEGLKKQLAIRVSVKLVGHSTVPIYEGRVFRERSRELQLKQVPTFFDKPSVYGCSCIVGMPDKRDKPLKSWTVYFKQDGV